MARVCQYIPEGQGSVCGEKASRYAIHDLPGGHAETLLCYEHDDLVKGRGGDGEVELGLEDLDSEE